MGEITCTDYLTKTVMVLFWDHKKKQMGYKEESVKDHAIKQIKSQPFYKE